MQRVTDSTSVSTMPAASSTGTPGFFTNGNPTLGTSATILTQDWANGVQEEILNVIKAPGLVPNIADNTQLLQALFSLCGKNSAVFLSPGTTIWTVPSGVTRVIAFVLGGGAAGQGANVTGGGQVAAGTGGQSGSWGLGIYPVFGGQQIPVTTGSGGASGLGYANSGGTSSFGTSLTARGGNGVGGNAASEPVPGNSSSFVALTQASGGTIINAYSRLGGGAFSANVGSFISGAGGASPFGSGGLPVGLQDNGHNGLAPGSGGSGAVSANGGGEQIGGTGAPGAVILMW